LRRMILRSTKFSKFPMDKLVELCEPNRDYSRCKSKMRDEKSKNGVIFIRNAKDEKK